MDRLRISPGPAAAQAYRLGVIAGAVAGLAFIGFLYWLGMVTTVMLVYFVVLLFPVYLVFVATALSVWLGYDKDETSLRPVYRPKNSE